MRVKNLTKILIQVVLLNSKLTRYSSKRLATSWKVMLVERGRLKHCLLLVRRQVCRSKGSCYSWLGLREVETARQLCRGEGGRHQGRSRGTWGLMGRVRGQGRDLLAQVI